MRMRHAPAVAADKPKGTPGRKVVIAQVAPAVRVAISETFGLAPGATSPGQLAAGLRQLGFDYVSSSQVVVGGASSVCAKVPPVRT